MKPKSSLLKLTGFMLLMVGSANAAVVLGTKGTINDNGRTISEATGNSLSYAAFTTTIASAFTNGTGGVANMTANVANFPGPIQLDYGASNSLELTWTGGNLAISEADASSGAHILGMVGSAATRVFTPDTPLLTIGIISTDRNEATRLPVLSVRFQDNTTASTSGANADEWFFHALSGTADNPIVEFSLSQNNFVRWDDLAFIAIPEPGAALLGSLGILLILRRRR